MHTKMNCKYYRTRTKKSIKYGYCTRDRKEVSLFCKECEIIEYNFPIKKMSGLKKKSPVKGKKSSKLSKLERNRFSIICPTSKKCYLCPSTNNLTWHEIYRGKNRSNSMKYGLCLRLCINCHEKYQEDKEFNNYWHKQAQIIFNKKYPDLDFLKIFRRNYL